MTTLQTADGRLLRRTGPRGGFTSLGTVGTLGPVWSNGEGQNGILTDGTLRSFHQLYRSQPVLYATINKLAHQIATLPLKVYKRRDDNDRERLFGHPVERLLGSPAPRCGPVHLKQWIAKPLLVHGNSLIGKWRGNGADRPPTELIPADWRYVSAYAPQGGPVEWWSTNQTGEERWIPVEETLHFAWQAPDAWVGVSPMEALAVTIRQEDAAQRHQTASFANGARPSGIVTLPEGTRPDRDVMARYREEINALHKGPDRSFGVAIMAPGADWKTLAFSSVEMELIEARKLNREEVFMAYDVKPTVVGDLTHGTYSNVTELNKDFYKTSLRPWLTLIEETLHAQLIAPEPEWADDDLILEFDLSEQLRGDPAEELEALVKAVSNGLMTINEARKVRNLPRVGDDAADQPLIPVNNMAPLSEGSGVEPPAVPPQLS